MNHYYHTKKIRTLVDTEVTQFGQAITLRMQERKKLWWMFYTWNDTSRVIYVIINNSD